jgi:hypothetical protein
LNKVATGPETFTPEYDQAKGNAKQAGQKVKDTIKS